MHQSSLHLVCVLKISLIQINCDFLTASHLFSKIWRRSFFFFKARLLSCHNPSIFLTGTKDQLWRPGDDGAQELCDQKPKTSTASDLKAKQTKDNCQFIHSEAIQVLKTVLLNWIIMSELLFKKIQPYHKKNIIITLCILKSVYCKVNLDRFLCK